MKSRVDTLLVERGLAESRNKAQALVIAGRVYSGEQRIDKPGTSIDSETVLTVREGNRFASRGGLKLDAALDELGVEVAGKICADIGASTGGFTDCLMKRGAVKVYAVDVGRGQLAEPLRTDERVVVLDETNARHLTKESFDDEIALATVDVSFIGIEKLAPALADVLDPPAELVVLVKPQFEVGKEVARKARGVIRDEATRAHAIEQAIESIEAVGFRINGRADSTTPGPKGNVEHFVHAIRA